MIQQTTTKKSAVVRIPFSAPFLPLAMEFADKGARGFGYGDREAGGLVLAVEELFSFYAQRAAGGSMVEIGLEDQGYRLALSISFHAANPDMRAFNLTWRVSHDCEESLHMLGPMLAARSVSSLRLDFDANERVVIRMTRDRDYAPAGAAPLPPRDSAKAVRPADPSPDDLRHFAAMVTESGSPFLPSFLARPGMAADMLAAGHLHASLPLDNRCIPGGVPMRPLTVPCMYLYGHCPCCADLDDRSMTIL